MWIYKKNLMYPVRVNSTDPNMAKMLLTAYGGADGRIVRLLTLHESALLHAHRQYSSPAN